MEFVDEQAEGHDLLGLSGMAAQKLYDVGLISENEKLKMEELNQANEMSAIVLDLLLKKDSEISHKMLDVLRSLKTAGEPACLAQQNKFGNPFEINQIIKSLFCFLNLKDIKNGRLVCQKWNYEAEPFLRRLGKIKFKVDCSEFASKFHNPVNFAEVFSSSTTAIPFTAFRFDGKFPLSTFNEFFEHQRNNVKELHLIQPELQNGNVTLNVIRSWIENSPMLTKLDIDGRGAVVYTSDLKCIKSLTLRMCTLNVDSKHLLTPIQVSLSFVKFQQAGTIGALERYRINDSIDFSKAKIIHLNNGFNIVIEFLFDMSDCSEVEDLCLNEVIVNNWTSSKCSVNTLKIGHNIFEEAAEMKVKELYLYCTGNKVLDLDILPTTIEKLHLRIVNCQLTPHNNLKNLKILSLIIEKEASETPPDFVYPFKDCDQLNDIVIYNYSDLNFTLDVSCMPKSVKRIQLQGIAEIYGEMNLETLVLEYYSLRQATKVLEHILPKVLVINWMQGHETIPGIFKFSERFGNIKLYIGPVKWSGLELQECLSAYVNERAEFYVFENGKGLSVNSSEFRHKLIIAPYATWSSLEMMLL